MDNLEKLLEKKPYSMHTGTSFMNFLIEGYKLDGMNGFIKEFNSLSFKHEPENIRKDYVNLKKELWNIEVKNNI